jgi:hypothetical protein
MTSLEAQRTGCVHQLCYSVPPADTEPPGKVAVVELKAVRLMLDFSTIEKAKVSRKRKRIEKDGTKIMRQPELLGNDIVCGNGKEVRLCGDGKQSY